MKTMMVGTCLVALVALTACDTKTCETGADCDTSSVVVDTSPTEIYDGATTIDDVEWNCDEVGYWYVVETVGWSAGGDLWIYQTGSDTPWDEYHPLPVFDADPYGYETMLYLALEHVDSANEQVAGETTLFDCDSKRQATLSWLVTVTDDLGNDADCLAWGDDADFFSKECENLQ